MTRHIESSKVWRPHGRGFSMGVIQPEGRVIHLTGQVAWDAEENIVGKGDVAGQTRQCFRNIENLLLEVGGSINDIISITTYFLELADLASIQAVRNEFLSKANPPVSTSVRVAGLGHEDFLVELTPVAVVPYDRFK
ncbi:enamine deaminase RidA [Chromatiales bacterium (ex Bugula neritina AB1)]|nr:enamine deaminase RidA [Chromatiales bacterium (ex Bugula neritina AB1)]